MDALLFLAHRLPYPPNKGDKVRSYHWLRHLSKRFRIFLGTFVDDPDDWQYVDALRSLCADIHVEPLRRWSRLAAGALSFASGKSVSLPYFWSARLDQWVRSVGAREGVSSVFAYSAPMAQYAFGLRDVRTVIDFVDLDSAKWIDYAKRRTWPLSTLYRREAERLFEFEQQTAGRAYASIFVTEDEARALRARNPAVAASIVTIRNGVDSRYFAPSADRASPFRPGERPIVFTGAMDYWPNVDAVLWFAREVLPEVLNGEPAARFYIVGMNPESAVRALQGHPAVTVTGRVPDVRPYLQHADLAVAPLRVARGIQNKVLEAMAMGKPVVATVATVASLTARPGVDIESATEPAEFAAKVVALFDPGHAARMGELARQRIIRDYDWPAAFGQLDTILEGNERFLRTTGRAAARSGITIGRPHVHET